MIQPKVLVLEEDDQVAKLIENSLKREGYEVRIARDRACALSQQTSQGFDPDLLVTDLRLSTSSGLTVADELCELLPLLTVIVTSGYAYPALEDQGCEHRNYHFLPKPFGTRELVNTVNQALSRV